MKKIVLLPLILLLGCATLSYSELFSDLRPADNSAYGYNPENPIKIGFYDPQKSVDASYNFLSNLRKNGKPLELIYHVTVEDPSSKMEGTKFRRFQKSLKGGLLDAYVVVPHQTQDTLTLYFDIYHKDSLKVPKGLNFVKE